MIESAITLKDTSPVLNQCQTQWYLQDPIEEGQAMLYVAVSKREKDEAQPIISYMYLILYFIIVNMKLR